MAIKVEKEIYDFFATFVYDKTGIHYPEKDYYRLDSRITTLMNHYQCATPKDLYNLYKTKRNKDMEVVLIDLCTNNETYFFRDVKPFDALTKEIIPNILKSKGSVNLWSAACSTGQEVLSIVMGLLENNPSIDLNKVNIYATDISQKALSKANSFIYSSLEVQRGLPVTLLVKYFDQLEDGRWQFKNEYAKKLKFETLNLLTDNFKPNFYDVICCRNVLIYQNKDNKQAIMHKLYDSLKNDGYLLMGSGESLIGTDVELQQSSVEGAMFFTKSQEVFKKAG